MLPSGTLNIFWLLERVLGPRSLKMVPRVALRWPKMAQYGPKVAQDGSKVAPRWSNMGHRAVLQVAFDR